VRHGSTAKARRAYSYTLIDAGGFLLYKPNIVS